ncbi:MAG: hypothetical protein KJ620_00160, partial [Candidatus Edwardsbacteria bacterium]|nr:hypothetical protein [Candidatus Edwardsbacteria bacterium]MBU1576094.1 hypothetical protein [Candidatus Edwardsbacteria bacterium]
YMDASTKKPIKLVKDLIIDERTLCFSPDGYKIGFVGWYEDGKHLNDIVPQIYIYYMENKFLYQATRYQTGYNGYGIATPILYFSWGKNSDQILFFYNPNDGKINKEFNVLNLNTLKTETLPMPTVGRFGIGYISDWSYNNEYFALCDLYDLYLYEFKVNKWRRLTDNKERDIEDILSWTKDGSKLLYKYYNYEKTFLYDVLENKEIELKYYLQNIKWMNKEKGLYFIKYDSIITVNKKYGRRWMPNLYILNNMFENEMPLLVKEDIYNYTLINDSTIVFVEKYGKQQNCLCAYNIYTKKQIILADKKYKPENPIGYYKQ